MYTFLVFICDGCELDSKTKCDRFHKGFHCDLPGENLRKMAPALILMGKIVNHTIVCTCSLLCSSQNIVVSFASW